MTRFMRKWIILLILLCTVDRVGMSCFAQNILDRRIYLWDVTLSMKGKGAKETPNIYNDVVDFLVRDINSLTDMSTEIVVLPFQTTVLETWRAKATEEGKKAIVAQIKGYKNDVMTNTNIVGPIEYVKNKHIDDNRRNMLILLTDGQQSQQFGGNDKLLESIRGWQEYAQMNDAYLVYVMLTKEAVNDGIKYEADRQERVCIVTPPMGMEFVELNPAVSSFNIKDDRTINIVFTSNKNIAIPENLKISVRTIEESPLEIDAVSEICNGRIEITPKYDYETLKTQLPEQSQIKLVLNAVNSDEIKKSTGKIVLLSPSSVKMNLINKREKTLTIKMK